MGESSESQAPNSVFPLYVFLRIPCVSNAGKENSLGFKSGWKTELCQSIFKPVESSWHVNRQFCSD